MNKPKLTQKYGGWTCTDENLHGGTILRWAETPEEAYEEYLKAYKEVEALRLRIKQYEIAHIPLDRLTETGKPTYTNDFRTERPYPYYTIYENVEKQENEVNAHGLVESTLSALQAVTVLVVVVLLLINMRGDILHAASFVIETFNNLR